MRKLVSWSSCVGTLCLLLINLIVTSGFVEVWAAERDAEKSDRRVGFDVKNTGSDIDAFVETDDGRMQDAFNSLGLPEAKETRRLMVLGVPVLDNALGDMNQDSVVNILDLLRVRNIHAGIGDPATPYELAEGDMNLDQLVDQDDVTVLRDVLLRRMGVPHVIDDAGGEVASSEGRTTVTIPENAFAETKLFCLENFPQSDLEELLRTQVNTWGPEVQYLAGAVLRLLNPLPTDSGVPATIGFLEEIPDGMTLPSNGRNVIFSIGPDVDGDGTPELNTLGNLKMVMTDEGKGALALQSGHGPAISLDTYDRVSINPDLLTVTVLPMNPVEPAEYIALRGDGWTSGFGEDYEVWWIGNADTIVTTPDIVLGAETVQLDSTRGIATIVPWLEAGDYSIRVWDRFTGRESNGIQVAVAPLAGTILPGIYDSLASCFSVIDSALTKDLSNPILVSEYSDLYDITFRLRTSIRSLIDSLPLAGDSIMSQQLAADILRAFDNANLLSVRETQSPGIATHPEEDECGGNVGACISTCIEESTKREKGLVTKVVCRLACGAAGGGPLCGRVCSIVSEFVPYDSKLGFDKWCRNLCCNVMNNLRKNLRSNSQGKGQLDNNLDPIKPSGDPNSLDTPLGCFHLCCDKLLGVGDAGSTSGVGSGSSNFNQSKSIDTGFRADTLTTLPVGTMIGVVDSPIPISKGVVTSDGLVVIPFNVLTGDVQVFAFDPKTGFFDPEIATFNVSTIGESATFRMQYMPDTSTVIHTLTIPDWTIDTIAPGAAKFEYRVFVPESQVGESLNIGFRANEALTFWLQNPSDAYLLRDSLASCQNIVNFVPDESGTHTVTIAFGAAGGQGEFALGVSVAPDPPTPYLCGDVPYDTLQTAFSPYIVANPASFESAGTAFVEEDVVINFMNGGLITGGLLQLVGSASGPFILRPTESPPPKAPPQVATNQVSDRNAGEVQQ